ncbi:hypothetical protein RhiJN_19764 [Ceratobasidium sp. AG-Ba]|nr:hypothetical protein RhiJN_04933 [Ceratobasidium sp. AG-Ba]QRV91746.1 hypothetical protein RhiJN_19764 [Ceratobasidium sp. AG-Ba]
MSLPDSETRPLTSTLVPLTGSAAFTASTRSTDRSTATISGDTSLLSSSVLSGTQTTSIHFNILHSRPPATSQSTQVPTTLTREVVENISFDQSPHSTSNVAGEAGAVASTTAIETNFAPPCPIDDMDCPRPNTFGITFEFTNTPLGTPKFATVAITTESGTIKPVTTLPIRSSITPTPTRSRPLILAPTNVTGSQGELIATSATLEVVPTFSVFSNDDGPVTSAQYNLTIPVSSWPAVYSLTTWTTYTITGGSTVPLVAEQTNVLTSAAVTYTFQPSSTGLEPTSSTASPNAEAVQTQSSRESKIVGGVVGGIIGLVLLGVFIWVLLSNRKKHHAPDYAARQSTIWGSRTVQGSDSNDGSILDLDSEPSPRPSFIEPWIEGEQVGALNQKVGQEMEELGGAGDGRARWGRSCCRAVPISSPTRRYDALRSPKSADRVPLELRPEPLVRWPARSRTISSTHSSEESGSDMVHHPIGTSLSTTQPLVGTTRPAMQPPPPAPLRRQEPATEEPRLDAIPPTYNEAWNVRRASPNQ